MIEKVELRFERETAKESPRDVIVRHAKEEGTSGSRDWEVFDQRVATHEDYGVKEPVHAGFRKTFYLGSKHLLCNSENIHQRADLSCDQCGYVTSLFDATVNGYVCIANQSESLALPPNDELFESDVAVSLGIGHFEIK